MKIPGFFYQVIYHRQLNYVFRNVNFILNSILKTKFKTPPSGIFCLKTDSGKLKISTNQTSYVSQLLFWNGYKKFEFSDIFEKLAKDTNCFFDIGSNIGYYSLLAAKSNPNIKAYAFEPALGPKFYLNENISINNFQNNIEAIDLALSSKIGDIDFYEVQNVKYKYLKYNLAGEGNAGTKTTSRNFVKNMVKTTTLDDFVNSNKINGIDLIKIDTEGTEVDILNSGKAIIKKHQPIIICETLFNTIEDQLEDFFKGLDYQFYNHTSTGLEKVSTIKRIKDDGIRNCFFIPKSKSDLISKFAV